MARGVTTATPSTRERLVSAAAELIETGGYVGASVAAIAERAGVATGTLYRHYPSKAELFVEVFRTIARRELDELYAASGARQGSFADRLDAVVTTYARRALSNPRLAWALVHEPVDPLVDAERLAYRRDYTDRMAGLLRDGIAHGDIPDQDAQLSAAAIVGAIAEALVGPLSPVRGEAAPPEEITRGIAAFCRRAVGA
jgi:AcrR family transcriptional regulator